MPVYPNLLWLSCGDCNPTPDGYQYLGHISVTSSGFQCQAWASQYPNSHSYVQDEMYPDGSVESASNYCRNPDDGWDEGLWCYVTDPSESWDYCDVPLCGTTTASAGWFHVNLCNLM